jgi:hypothetical protein
MITLLLLVLLQQPAVQTQEPAAQPEIVDGRGGPTVTIPRIDATIQVDGRLDEEAWGKAVRLGGFSQYLPSDSRPAVEQTEVLVWYSPTALHFGIISHDRQPGSVRATVADRDNLGNDDTVTIYLDTFNDRRRAFFFTVNPLGVQQDGVQTEGGFNAGSMGGAGGWGGGGTMSGGSIDTSPDYQWDSKGQLTSDGYVVEVRIPFKSLRFGGNGPQRWGLNIRRKTQRTGYEDTWTDAKRVSSFLGQAGAIEGLHDLKRGVVTELQPVVMTTSKGTTDAGTGTFAREAQVQPGFNARFAFTNLSIDATVKPDFSQVESDAGLVTVNERFALFYAEKRPFFLEGIELFASPNQLVYTRQIGQPIAGGKLTGKVGRTTVAYLVAEDDISGSATSATSPNRALFNIARVRRDLWANSTAGVTYTDRTTAEGYNRVVAADSRVVFKKLYYLQGQLGGSWTGADGTASHSAPIWMGEFDRTAPHFGFNYKVNAVGTDFISQSGYVPRSDIVEAHASNRLTWYGTRGAALESLTTFFSFDRIWRYDDFPGRSPLEGNESVNLSAQLRGGWQPRASVTRQFVVFDRQTYAGYLVAGPGGTLAAYDAPIDLRGSHAYSISLTTPTFQVFNASFTAQRNDVAIFPEASQGLEMRYSASLSARPSGQLRIDATATLSRIARARDGSEFARTVLPRAKVEYQATRSLFFRIVGEYRAQDQDALFDPRTGALLYPGGIASTPTRAGTLRVDYLLSYKPSPGTVAFIGYGSSLESPLQSDRLWDVHRTSDGFFVKLAYLFRR